MAREYMGTVGKKENAHSGVLLCYSSDEGAVFIDRELYLPKERTAQGTSSAQSISCASAHLL
jgi:SRSO17 transposase